MSPPVAPIVAVHGGSTAQTCKEHGWGDARQRLAEALFVTQLNQWLTFMFHERGGGRGEGLVPSRRRRSTLRPRDEAHRRCSTWQGAQQNGRPRPLRSRAVEVVHAQRWAIELGRHRAAEAASPDGARRCRLPCGTYAPSSRSTADHARMPVGPNGQRRPADVIANAVPAVRFGGRGRREALQSEGQTSYRDCRWTAGDASARNFSPSAPTTRRTVSNVGMRSPESAL